LQSNPVLDSAGQFVGLVSEARLRRSLAEGMGDRAVAALTDRREALFPDQPLVDALVRMDQVETRQLAVVDRANPERLIGLLALSDIVRAQARCARGAGGSPAPAPAFSEVETTLTDQPAFRGLRPFTPEPPAATVAPETDLRYHTVVLTPDAAAVGRLVRALDLPRGVLLVTIERDGQTLVPNGATVLAAGDRVTFFALPQHLVTTLTALMGASAVDGVAT
jgi:TrkA-C domain/CBS domain